MIDVLFYPIKMNCKTWLGLNNYICSEYLKNIGGSNAKNASLHTDFGA